MSVYGSVTAIFVGFYCLILVGAVGAEWWDKRKNKT